MAARQRTPSRNFTLRLTTAERTRIEAAAALRGVPLSNFVRAAALGAASRTTVTNQPQLEGQCFRLSRALRKAHTS